MTTDVLITDPKMQETRSEKTDKKRKPWTCPDCGKTYVSKYRYVHPGLCKGKPEVIDERFKKAKEAAKKIDEQFKPSILSDIIDDKPTNKPETKQPKETIVEKPLIDEPDPATDKRLNFYAQIGVVVAVVVVAVFMAYKAITNGNTRQEYYAPEIDLGFTDSRGVYYGPGEYSHERG